PAAPAPFIPPDPGAELAGAAKPKNPLAEKMPMIIGGGAAAVLIVVVVCLHLFYYAPQIKALQAAKTKETDDLKKQLTTAKEEVNKKTEEVKKDLEEKAKKNLEEAERAAKAFATEEISKKEKETAVIRAEMDKMKAREQQLQGQISQQQKEMDDMTQQLQLERNSKNRYLKMAETYSNELKNKGIPVPAVPNPPTVNTPGPVSAPGPR
ncbi:MAG: hypothetical protein SFY92_08405, partial [Verrucomicrobiae bacterium]|nr:hypothetical protein [Verrucomicrobiae bacterium]